MTLKKSILTIAVVLTSLTLRAQTMADAEKAYQSANYNEAVVLYEQIIGQGKESAALYYNLGNAYYRLGQNGKAILNYERALRLKPGDSDTRENLALAESRTTDRIPAIPQMFISRWYSSIVSLLSPSGWRIVLLCLLAIVSAIVVIFMLSTDYRRRRTLVIIGGVAVMLLLASIAITISSSVRFVRHNEAIVTQQAVVVKGSPENDSVDKFILHEGTKVHIDEQLSGWYKIRLADGSTGWMAVDDIEVI